MNIEIDFIGGTHGNYLSFLLNKLLLGEEMHPNTPFTDLGTSHAVSHLGMPVICGHWSMPNLNKDIWWVEGKPAVLGNNVIVITVGDADHLPITQLQFHRGGDRGCDPAYLETDTYFKLSQSNLGLGKNMLADLNIIYNNINYETDHNIFSPNSWEDALEQEGTSFSLTEETPHCPRNILRDYLKKEFNYFHSNKHHGFSKCLKKYNQSKSDFNDKRVYYLPYQSFYNKSQFLAEITKVKEFFKLDFHTFDIENLHNEFLARQPYKDSIKKVENVLENICNKRQIEIPKLDVIQEGYINSQIEQIFKVKLPIGLTRFPVTVNELVKQYELNK